MTRLSTGKYFSPLSLSSLILPSFSREVQTDWRAATTSSVGVQTDPEPRTIRCRDVILTILLGLWLCWLKAALVFIVTSKGA